MSNPAMVGEVNKLVKDQLMSVRVVCFPGIGTLRVERVGAKRLSKRTILPPHRVVTFSSQAEGEPFPNAIARAAGCDAEQAFTVYERWCSYVLINGVLTIEGVGVLKQKHFTPDQAFDKQLNPQGYAPMQLHLKQRLDWAIWCGIAAILFAVGFGGYQFLQMQPDPGEVLPALTTQTPAGQAVVVPQADALAESVVAETVDEKSEPADAAEAGNSTAGKSSSVATDPQSGSVDMGRKSAAGQPAETPASKSAADSQPVANEGPAKLVSGRRYVVLGVFSTPENAARAVQAAEKQVPGIRCSVYVFGDKWMISPFSSEDIAACTRFVIEYNDRLPDIWVYRAH